MYIVKIRINLTEPRMFHQLFKVLYPPAGEVLEFTTETVLEPEV